MAEWSDSDGSLAIQGYITRRLLLMVPTVIGITVVIFATVRIMPGDFVDQQAGFGGSSAEVRERLRESYSLDDSIFTQYIRWVGGLVQGDFGQSLISQRDISTDIGQRLPVTVELGLMGLLVSWAIAVPVGVISAIRQDSLIDHFARSFAISLLALPSFWLGLLALTYGFVWFEWTPPLRYEYFWDDPISNLQITIVPAIILGSSLSGSVMRLTRSTMLEVLRQDYIRTAWAKGLSERKILLRHALRNAIVPVVTVLGLQIPVLIGGTVILEQIFSLPGMGSYFLSAIQPRDYPVVQAVVFMSAVAVVITNLVVDLAYAAIDPRIKYG